MRHIAFTALAACSFVLLSMARVEAVGSGHAFCLQGDEYPGLSACTFDTYEQCLATASGRKVYCVANPYFVGETYIPMPTAIVIDPSRGTTIRSPAHYPERYY